MIDPHDKIAGLEAEIEALADAAERCRKINLAAKVATVAGCLLFLVTTTGLIRFGPAALVVAIAAVLGGLALSGSNKSTHGQIRARIRAHEVRRAQIISGLDLRDIGSDERA